jgi:hypothetical protein
MYIGECTAKVAGCLLSAAFLHAKYCTLVVTSKSFLSQRHNLGLTSAASVMPPLVWGLILFMESAWQYKFGRSSPSTTMSSLTEEGRTKPFPFPACPYLRARDIHFAISSFCTFANNWGSGIETVSASKVVGCVNDTCKACQNMGHIHSQCVSQNKADKHQQPCTRTAVQGVASSNGKACRVSPQLPKGKAPLPPCAGVCLG